jgi:hypothetical protein
MPAVQKGRRQLEHQHGRRQEGQRLRQRDEQAAQDTQVCACTQGVTTADGQELITAGKLMHAEHHPA